MITTTRMDPDGEKNNALLENENDTDCFFKKKIIDNISFSFQFFSSIWIRRYFRTDNEMDRILLDYGFNFLPYIGMFFYVILFFSKIV